MKILLINLPSSVERLHFQQEQFKSLDLKFEVLPAISVADISEQQYQEQAFGWERPLRKVELACFLSHKSAWEKVLEYNEPCLILEDDAILAKQSQSILSEIVQRNFQDIDLINLEVRSRKKIISKEAKLSLVNESFKLFELYQDRTGAAGYILYPSGAKKLLNRLEKSTPAIADGFICASYELQGVQIEPAVIIQQDQMQAYGLIDDLQFNSTIGRSEHHKAVYRNVAEKIAFKQRRIWGQVLMAMRFLQVLFKSNKRFIHLNKDDFKKD